MGCGSSFYLYRPIVRVRCVGGVCCMKILVLSKHPPIAIARRRAHAQRRRGDRRERVRGTAMRAIDDSGAQRTHFRYRFGLDFQRCSRV